MDGADGGAALDANHRLRIRLVGGIPVEAEIGKRDACDMDAAPSREHSCLVGHSRAGNQGRPPDAGALELDSRRDIEEEEAQAWFLLNGGQQERTRRKPHRTPPPSMGAIDGALDPRPTIPQAL